jgi:hypothetical protein
MTKPRKHAAQPAPHSWAIESWPSSVYPGSPGKGRYLIRSNRTALIAAGAISRVGRDLVILGAPFSRFLESQIGRVENFATIPANQVQVHEQAAA